MNGKDWDVNLKGRRILLQTVKRMDEEEFNREVLGPLNDFLEYITEGEDWPAESMNSADFSEEYENV